MIDIPKPQNKEEIYKFLFGSIFLLNTQLEKIGPKVLKEITAKQWFLLACVTTFFEHPPTISEVASALSMSHQNVKQVALRLEKKGLFNLLPDPKDSRATRIHLTEGYTRYAERRDEPSDAFLQKLFADIPQEEALSCYHTLLKMLLSLDKLFNTQ